MGKARLNVAVLGCEPENAIRFTYGNQRYPARHLVRKRIESFGERYKPIVHWPVNNIRDFPGTNNIDAVVIPGSSLNIDDEALEKTEWMRKLLDFIAHTHEKVPMLGICFGHQAIAKTFGSDVMSYTRRRIFYEIGFEMTKLTDEGLDDPIFKEFPERFMALYAHFQYVHIDSIPVEFDVLAKSINRKNKSIQAYKIGDATYGVQFHPDYNEDSLAEILTVRNEIIRENIGFREIIRSTNIRHDHKVLKNFLDIVKEI